ncbi:AEC family transporter [Pseudomonas sp. PCH199]|uniref:AEC family transporter n=1 Tax=unclassified Pseudomonas TaxID=196821 RepID=UPI000BDA19D3|nr:MULTISPECIES: AEC family transporter [unclassified Pseudomonas]MCW8277743.1 AEC family transporter [Pseudomonas sp. PCH199]PAM82137.1 transporter [Pseudomonas sp. ERMR1:02]
MLDRIVGPILPVAFVIVLGYIAGKRGRLTHSDSLLISRLVLGWIFPALLFVGMASTPREQLFDFKFIVATFIGIMGMYTIALVIGWLRFRDLKIATLKGFVNGYPDAAFMGIPILGAMFGAGSIYSVLVLNLVASLVMIPVTTMLLTIADGKGSGTQAFVSSLSGAVRRPLMWAPALGILLSLLQVKLPPLAAESLNLLGKATPGVSLLCLGLIMSSEKLKMSGEVWTNLGLKLFIHPVLMFAATVVLGTHGLYAQQMILLCALPSATIPAMFANQTGAYQSEAATSILVSTVLSIVTFSAAIYLIDGGLAAA